MMQEEKWLIAVTAGRWQKHGIREAKAAGIKVLAIDTDPAAEGFAEADKSLCIDFTDHDKVISELKAMNIAFSGAVSFCSEVGMMLAAKIREAFGLPGPKPDLCERLLDKAVQRSVWTKAGVPGPASWKVFHSVAEGLSEINQIKIPFILKPIDSSGSRGVAKIESTTDDITDAINRAFHFSRSNQVIAESYMDGTEFTVEVFVVNGEVNVLAITEKKKVEGTRGTVAKELATPDRPKAILDKIKQAVIGAFRSLDYTEGPGHAEIILLKDNSVGLVEVAGRGGGFMVFDKLVPSASGVNIARLTAMQSVGLPVGQMDIKETAVVLRFFPSKPGVLESISGFDEANLIKGVESAPFVEVGDKFDRATADGDRLGYILTKAATPAEAQRLADEAESKVFFDIKNIQ
jgi:biotin carboxylase